MILTDDGNKLKDVTAWMPLSEPYKEVMLYPQVDGITLSVISICTEECHPELNDDTDEVKASAT